MLICKKAAIDDFLKIQMIANETWPNTYEKILSREQINYMLDLNYSEESLKKQMAEKRHNFILAEKDDQPLGFTSYEVNYNSESQLMIHKLYILPMKQGLGIGTKFLNFLSVTAQQNKINTLSLKVYFENTKAIRFYEKYGFKKAGTEKTEIGNNYKILDNVMVKHLQ